MSIKKILLCLGFTFGLISRAFATPSTPGGGDTPGCWPPPCSVPIDGGAGILLAVGAALGAKKILDSREKRN